MSNAPYFGMSTIMKFRIKIPKVVEWVIQQTEHKLGEVTVTRGNTHVFVGIDIEIMENKK